MAAVANLAEELRTLLGAECVGEREGKPLVSPRTTEEVAAVARYADEHKVAVEITGAGTKRGWGNPVAADLLLDTTRLTGVREHSASDLTATVAAGTPWDAMQGVLAVHGQRVALDPLWPATATVGGVIATNDSGAWRLRYGSLRDLIIGMTIVLADGTIAKSGGKVVKNVAGYDLHKLMTGAFGTLGIITEVTFRLHPLPKHTQTFTIAAPQATQFAPLMRAIQNSHLLTQGVQIRCNGEGAHLDIELDAHPSAAHADLLREMTHAAGFELSDCGEQAANLWGTRETLFRDGATVIKLSVLPTELCETLVAMQNASDVSIRCVAQASGLIFAALEGAPAAIESYLQSLKADVAILASTNAQRWKAEPSALPLMREIKRQFDPNRVLNPGRFVGGI